jgi:cation transport ATPase
MASTSSPVAEHDEHYFDKWIALLATIAIAIHLSLRFTSSGSAMIGPLKLMDWPLIVALVGGGLPLVAELLWKLVHFQFGSDLLAGLSIITSILLGEYLAGTLVVRPWKHSQSKVLRQCWMLWPGGCRQKLTANRVK